MDLNFFKQTRILDGGMGQELLARGMKPNGTLWSANAILDENYHQLLQDTHRDFIKAGAEVIVTTTFTTRRKRLRENNIEDKFEYLNIKAGEIAHKVKKEFPNVLIAGGLPPQELTYEADERSEEEIINTFNEQARLLNDYVDFFYFDVWSSIKEFKCGIKAIKEFKKPYLIGIHISEGTNLPSPLGLPIAITTSSSSIASNSNCPRRCARECQTFPMTKNSTEQRLHSIISP